MLLIAIAHSSKDVNRWHGALVSAYYVRRLRLQVFVVSGPSEIVFTNVEVFVVQHDRWGCK